MLKTKPREKTCHGIKRVKEESFDLDNRVKLIRVKVYYKHGSPNECEATDFQSTIKALVAFCEL